MGWESRTVRLLAALPLLVAVTMVALTVRELRR